MSFKKNIYKKVIAAATALVMAFAAAGCGESTSWIAKYNDKTVTSGIYIFYQTQAYSEATSKLGKQNEELDLADVKVLKTLSYENTDLTTWINNQAMEKLKIYMAVNQKFDELGLSFTDEEKSEMDNMLEMYWQYYSENYEKNGIGKESFKELIQFDYKRDKVFEYYYGEGGEKEVSDDEISNHLEGNYSRVKMIKLDLTDGNGEDLDEAGKKEIKKMAEDYKKRAIAGESFDDLIAEYSDYRQKLVEEATAEEGSEDETSEEEPDVTTTPAVTTTAAVSSEEEVTTTASEDEKSEEASEDTEESDSEESTDEEAEDEDETSDEEAEDEDEASDEEAEDEDEASDEETEDEKSDSDDKDTDESAEETDETSEEDTDAEEDPYANENIYRKGSEDDGYQPSQLINDAIFNDVVVGGEPYIIEDTDAKYVYVIQRLNILERKDFYEGDKKSSILWEMLEENFNTMVLEWLPEGTFTINNGAVKRYDPFNIKID